LKTPLYIDKHTELVARCKLGERKAQYELYKHYSKSMFNVCMRILNHQGEAEDALQDAFVDAFSNLHQFKGTATFGAWLKQIVVNRAINHVRARKIIWVEMDGSEVHLPDTNTQGWSEEDLHFEVDRVRAAMSKLTDGYRVVLSLYLFEGYDHEEIGTVLGINETTSRSQYLRGKRKLLELLSGNRI
jgi:RNA polymerase sigma factor (sigma-70 family)